MCSQELVSALRVAFQTTGVNTHIVAKSCHDCIHALPTHQQAGQCSAQGDPLHVTAPCGQVYPNTSRHPQSNVHVVVSSQLSHPERTSWYFIIILNQAIDMRVGSQTSDNTPSHACMHACIHAHRSPGRPPAKPIQYNDFMGKHTSRQRYWARSMLGYELMIQAQPNDAHRCRRAKPSSQTQQAPVCSHPLACRTNQFVTYFSTPTPPFSPSRTYYSPP